MPTQSEETLALFTPREVPLETVVDWMQRAGPPIVDALLRKIVEGKPADLRHMADHELAVLRVVAIIGMRDALIERVRRDKELDVLKLWKRMVPGA